MADGSACGTSVAPGLPLAASGSEPVAPAGTARVAAFGPASAGCRPLRAASPPIAFAAPCTAGPIAVAVAAAPAAACCKPAAGGEITSPAGPDAASPDCGAAPAGGMPLAAAPLSPDGAPVAAGDVP